MSLPFADTVSPYLVLALRSLSKISGSLSIKLSDTAEMISVLPPCATSSISLLFLGIVIVLILPTILKSLISRSIRLYFEPPKLPIRQVKGFVFSILRFVLPNVRAKVQKEIEGATRAFEKSMIHSASPISVALPETGLGAAEAAKELRSMAKAEEPRWDSGTLSGAIYMVSGFEQVFAAAGELYARANLLHPENFTSSRQMEAEVVSWVAEFFKGKNSTPVGSMTSGGTESLLLAIKTYRDKANALKGVVRPNIVVSETAHAAFWKAGQYFGVEVRVAPCYRKCTCKSEGRVCLGWMLGAHNSCKKGEVIVPYVRTLVDENTIAIVGSAPNYPYGTIDPLEELGAIALERGIGLHVDACLGGMLLPFAHEAQELLCNKEEKESGDLRNRKGQPKDAGPSSSPSTSRVEAVAAVVNFGIPGVTSLSCDTHKYGCAPKGTSILLWANEEYRKFQFAFKTDWTGGVYATPTICGSRAAAPAAACWGVMRAIGCAGYREQAREIFSITRAVAEGIVEQLPELELLGRADVSVVAFAIAPSSSNELDIFEVAERMKSIRHWHLNLLQGPPGCHIAVTPANAEMVKKFLVQDLKTACQQAKGKGQSQAAAFYGATANAPIEIVEEIAEAYLNVCYKVKA